MFFFQDRAPKAGLGFLQAAAKLLGPVTVLVQGLVFPLQICTLFPNAWSEQAWNLQFCARLCGNAVSALGQNRDHSIHLSPHSTLLASFLQHCLDWFAAYLVFGNEIEKKIEKMHKCKSVLRGRWARHTDVDIIVIKARSKCGTCQYASTRANWFLHVATMLPRPCYSQIDLQFFNYDLHAINNASTVGRTVRGRPKGDWRGRGHRSKVCTNCGVNLQLLHKVWLKLPKRWRQR